MNTIILTPAELQNLPESVRTEILKVIETRSITIKLLKERIQKLPFTLISFRSDINTIERLEKEDHLTFRIWHKTAGEQWGNNAGREYKFLFGRKYIQIDGSFWSTNNSDQDLGRTSVSIEKVAEFIELLESAFQTEEDPENVDRDKILSIAANRLEKLMTPEYEY